MNAAGSGKRGNEAPRSDRYREDMVWNKKEATTIDQQLQEFEARLRRQMLREKLQDSALVRESFQTGSMPQIQLSIGALQASRPAAPEYETVSGD